MVQQASRPGPAPAGESAERSLILPDEFSSTKFGTWIDYNKIDQLIDGRAAYDLTWARALRCSCFNSTQTDQPDPSCVVCDGTGLRYVHPHPEEFPEYCEADGSVTAYGGQPVRGLLEGVSLAPDFFSKPGDWYSGKARLTVKGSVEIGHFDRFVMLDSEIMFDQVISRTAGQLVVTVGRNPRAQLRYPVVQVHALHTLTTRYRLRTDYTLDPNGEIRWVVGKGPPVGYFSLRYSFHPVWHIIDFPRSIAGARRSPKQTGLGKDVYAPMPLSATLALDFLREG
jgi:hypothetical protein